MAENVRRLQVSMNKQLADKGEEYIKAMGLNRNTVFSMLYQAIVNQGKLPFTPQVSERELAIQHTTEMLRQAIDDGQLKEYDMTDEEMKEMWNDDEEW